MKDLCEALLRLHKPNQNRNLTRTNTVVTTTASTTIAAAAELQNPLEKHFYHFQMSDLIFIFGDFYSSFLKHNCKLYQQATGRTLSECVRGKPADDRASPAALGRGVSLICWSK